MATDSDKIRQVFADDVISFTLNGKLYSGTILEVFTKWGEVADKLGNDADVLANENARLVSELETAKEWRLALELFTPNGSEYVNDLTRCVEFVREKLTDRHEAKKDVVRLRRKLETAKRALERVAGVDSGYPCSCGELAQQVLKIIVNSAVSQIRQASEVCVKDQTALINKNS